MTSQTPQTEYDSPWKDAIEEYFADCVRFFFPQVYADIDWSKGYTFLDKELQKIAPHSTITRRYVDGLTAGIGRKIDARTNCV